VKLDPNEAGCKDGDLMGLAQYQVWKQTLILSFYN
jgi:hypothetical protein